MPAITADKKIKQFEALLKIGQRLSSEMHLDRLLELILDETTGVMDADRSSLFLVDREKKELWSKIAQATTEIRLPIGKGIAGAVAKTGEIINIPDAYADRRFNPEVDKRTGYRTRSILCVPMKNPEGHIIGVIQVLNKKRGVFDSSDEDVLLALAGQAAVAVENARYHESALAQERLKKDLEFARTIQEGFLPASFPAVPGWEFAAQYRAAQEVGGDFYDFIPLGQGQMGVLIGDVSGKGVPAALFMARLMSDFRFYATALSSPGEVVGRMNSILVERSRRGMFVTLCYLLIDLAQGKITVVNAGHLAPLIRQADGKLLHLEGAANTPLGILAEQTFAEWHHPLGAGDVVILMTDGIIEAMNRKGALFGAKRIHRVAAAAARSAEQTGKSIFAAVSRFSRGAPQHDDLTLICLRRKQTGPARKKRGKPALSRTEKREEKVSLRIQSDPRYLALVRRNLEFLLAQDEVLDQEIQKIVLAVDEAAANVIRYAYQGDTEQLMDFEFSLSPDWLTIAIRDYGQKPDLEKIKPRELEEIRPGGLGTRFMREVMDEVNYDISPPSGTILTMKKRRSLLKAGQ